MAQRITEKKRIKINRECVKNPVFVTWLNTLGGREQWLFHTVQTEGLTTEKEETFEPYQVDLEESRGQIFDLSVFAQPQLILYTVIDHEDLEGLKSIIYSLRVEILMNADTWEADGFLRWQMYRPERGSWKILNTDEIRSEIEITLNNPYINNIEA